MLVQDLLSCAAVGEIMPLGETKGACTLGIEGCAIWESAFSSSRRTARVRVGPGGRDGWLDVVHRGRTSRGLVLEGGDNLRGGGVWLIKEMGDARQPVNRQGDEKSRGVYVIRGEQILRGDKRVESLIQCVHSLNVLVHIIVLHPAQDHLPQPKHPTARRRVLMSCLEGLPTSCRIVFVISDIPHVSFVNGLREDQVHGEVVLGPRERR